MGPTLRYGLEALLEEAAIPAAIIMLCDQPLLTAATLDALIDACQEGGRTVTVQVV